MYLCFLFINIFYLTQFLILFGGKKRKVSNYVIFSSGVTSDSLLTHGNTRPLECSKSNSQILPSMSLTSSFIQSSSLFRRFVGKLWSCLYHWISKADPAEILSSSVSSSDSENANWLACAMLFFTGYSLFSSPTPPKETPRIDYSHPPYKTQTPPHNRGLLSRPHPSFGSPNEIILHGFNRNSYTESITHKK